MKPLPIKQQTSCSYCETPFDKDLRYCPLCRKPEADLSGRYTQPVQVLKIAPITYSMPDKVSILLHRGQGESESLKGSVLAETSTHYKVQGLSPYNFCEWFAKTSNRVNCHPL